MTRYPLLHALLISLMGFMMSMGSASRAHAQSAAEDLVATAPKSSVILFGFNVAKAKDTTMLAELVKVARTSPDTREVLARLENDLGQTLEEDVTALMMAMPDLDNQSDDRMVVTFTGDFDFGVLAKKLKAEAPKTRKVHGYTLYGDDEIEIALMPDKKQVTLAGGPKTYRADAFALSMKGKGDTVSANAPMSKLLELIDPKAHMWMAIDASKLQQPKDGPGFDSVAMTFDFTDGLKLDGEVETKEEKDAVVLVEQFEANKSQISASAALFGAPSFMQNFSLKRAKKTLAVSSTMPSTEVSAASNTLQQMLKSAEAEKKRREQMMRERLQRQKEMQEKRKRAQEKAPEAPATSSK